MSATTTAAAAAITAAGFEVKATRTPAGRVVLRVAVPTLSDRLFDLLDVVQGLTGAFTVYPAGDDVTTCVAAR